jgi:hypothetical protein
MNDHEILIPIIAIVGAFGTPVAAILACAWYMIRKVSCETALKQAMVARGYSANEIVHVLTNGKGKLSNPSFDLPPAKPVKSVA